ncbi:hypothetical protein [Hymenobacter pini]|uniref:hypothetical protein n=1 Tax=Hymenobacter pini TaxID=2880879 RepID=UPI001CF0D6E6|nr:hypothetical protein [Hymenobacter pini]MCA8832689.1 hypothetical protein [Hymenobacter pini]
MLQVYAGKLLRRASIPAAGVVLASCSVYAPLQPAAPTIQKRGEAEVVASGYLNGRLEASAAYSPLKYVVVRAAGGLRPGGGDSSYFRIRQLEGAVGVYRPLAGDWVLGTMVGYGSGRSGRRFVDGGFEPRWDTVRTRTYDARFRKLHGEVYAAYEGLFVSAGGAFRVSRVNFRTLTDAGQPIPLRYMVRAEPMLFVRFRNPSVLPWLQLQLMTSLSYSPDERRQPSPDERIRDTKEGRLFTSMGLVIYPHLFKE